MGRPRKEQISLPDTPYYHIISRCVRRTFLCGYDKETQQNHEHRKQWIVDRIRLLSSVFTIDLCSYAVMSNHYHLVVKIEPEQSKEWTDKEVAQRWTAIFSGPIIIQKWLAGEPITEAEELTINSIIKVWRKRLCNISWYMKCLNEPIARKANREDDCTGHFWEARYKSQALLTEEALLSCMVYVDLNPIRAGITQTPESSDYTSIQERITPKWSLDEAVKNQYLSSAINTSNLAIKPLRSFKGQIDKPIEDPIPINLKDYIELVDATGRIVREDKRGYIPENLPSIFQRIKIQPEEWLESSIYFEENYSKKHQIKSKVDTG